ncbi:MAG: hypothetical protein H8E86_05505 [Planctomycetes bacterium]|nr:hypothetical protein [Planctomycetota bacterium]
MAAPAKKKKRRLGKGLESLLSKPVDVSPPPVVEATAPTVEQNSKSEEIAEGNLKIPPGEGLVYLSVDSIVPNPISLDNSKCCF